jgi:hypothetical protein
MVEVVWVYGYFSCFPDYVGMVGMYVGCAFCFVKVVSVFGHCRMFGYCRLLVLSLVSMMYSEILVEIWWP